MKKEEFLHMGHVQAIIDALVTVEALPGTPAYDLDSYLFVEDKTTKKPLGAIYDVIGPVTAPIYCIRFNKIKDINELNIKRGLKVFSAPKSQYTHYVFVKELMKYKGTDASWVGDIELPPEVAAELSDDEDQHNLQEVRKAQKRKHGSLERHQHFEESMNRCNTLKTRMAQISDIRRQMHRTIGYSNNPHRFPNDLFGNDNRFFANENSPLNRIPVPFDPTVPHPVFTAVFPAFPGRTPRPLTVFTISGVGCLMNRLRHSFLLSRGLLCRRRTIPPIIIRTMPVGVTPDPLHSPFRYFEGIYLKSKIYG
ncbi:hypothetical protein NQ317_015754 [Molorchus minor]|uniref:H/ACA ribonucleoprotein complex subunit n=1 Tax=Molorchus minor TaxID=1323400 RepID=A0ABQ9K209_9CUCU|nr:hypothetical protein NQ317_015754 [Molorchus minor]